jgi:hypothetical protein
LDKVQAQAKTKNQEGGMRDFRDVLRDVADRLPGWTEIGKDHSARGSFYKDHSAQGSFYIGYDAGEVRWEVEICALDPDRNELYISSDLNEIVSFINEWLANDH